MRYASEISCHISQLTSVINLCFIVISTPPGTFSPLTNELPSTGLQHCESAMRMLKFNTLVTKLVCGSARADLAGDSTISMLGKYVLGSLYSLEWTTGMPFDLEFNHKTPIIEPIRVWDCVCRVLHRCQNASIQAAVS